MGVARMGRILWLLRAGESKEQPNEHFNLRKIDLLRSTNSKLLIKIK
jgi:hypothetical protein